ncbi:protease inhibitor I42 family protein [Streptomyces sp. NPDC002755]|uniref:protease inhibitor I42 family protein n=1 Tax=Streptomyces sp. NPDC002884 TaxID=3154544 RepID=UPI00331862FF
MTAWSSRGTRAVAAALCTVTPVAGCAAGSDADGPTSHPTRDLSITAEAGERFTLSVPENASTREHWFVVAPQPDASVVRAADRSYEPADDGRSVGGGTLVLTFEATGRGSTRIVLLHCTFPTARTAACGGAGPSPTPTPTTEPERVTYRVDVR